MASLRGHLAAVLASVLTLVSACAPQTRVMTLPPAPETLFDGSEPIAVSADSAIIDRHGHVIAGAGEGAAKGAMAGGGASIVGGASTFNPFGLAAGIVLAPVFMVGGGLAGGIVAHSADETNAAIAAIEAVYTDSEITRTLPVEVSRRLDAAGYISGSPCPSTPASAQECVGPGASELEFVVKYGFATVGEYEPVLTFGVDVEAQASGAASPSDSKHYRWGYVSAELDFFEATANGAASLRRELRVAQEKLARRIVADLVLQRTETRISGMYHDHQRTPKFVPEALEAGVAARVPLEADLVNLRQAQLEP